MKLKLTVDGKVYEVDVEATSPEPAQPSYLRPASPTRIPAAAPSSPSPSTASSPAANESVADENKVCRSPISGVVVRVSAQIGQQIKANDVLMVLEAMKMEIPVMAPRAGTVKTVLVAEKQQVAEGQPLVILEF